MGPGPGANMKLLGVWDVGRGTWDVGCGMDSGNNSGQVDNGVGIGQAACIERGTRTGYNLQSFKYKRCLLFCSSSPNSITNERPLPGA